MQKSSLVLQNLELSVRDADAQLIIDQLPVVQGGQTQLEQLFQNLLSNAVKFRRAAVPPQFAQGTTFSVYLPA